MLERGWVGWDLENKQSDINDIIDDACEDELMM